MDDGVHVVGQSIEQIETTGRGAGDRGTLRMARTRVTSGARRVSRPRSEVTGERDATIAQALRRLEREHVALLLAICELEGPTGAQESPAMRSALLILLRDDLDRTQRALALAADGRYGTCVECGRPITRRTLELSPATIHCAVCETRR